ncbi:hypothetical protein ABAC460_01910 [Asticcacaulis sp. AC460]|uniref:DUF5703 domain-containing protein n=1 Tax=Asticcacaulis sp. AC460 TaxID=1282360 RepID=UPI0003C412C2|nr:DUF5703 domain-containing protein [Asticcacaulis sp. AC460]ESQ93033.1 hypothetical protein ABAC460_01910 [Asticcacaulis sp. AC460]
MANYTRRGAVGLAAAGAMAPLFPVQAAEVPSYNPVWTSQSRNALESMPCGGGDIGLNVWVEDNDVLFYVSRSGAFDETNAYLKLGRIRLKLNPDPFGVSFRQTLDLDKGHVVIEGQGMRLVLWVDAFSPVVHVEIDSAKPVELTAHYETWRTADRPYRPEELGMHRSYDDAPVVPTAFADTTAFNGNDVVSFHRNRDSDTVFDLLVKQQGLESVKDRMWNPLKGLTFGVLMQGEGLVPAGTQAGRYASTDFTAWRLKSRRPKRRHELRIHCHIANTDDAQTWRKGLNALTAKSLSGRATAQRKTQAWWQAFQDRSHIRINPGKGPEDAGWRISRNYQLFRHQLGTNAYGLYPTKFNGGNFTTDPEFVDPSIKESPDFRKWGGGIFTAQNQRLVYWPMLKSGDFDLMDSQFLFYARALGNAELRTEIYWKHKGASFTEQIENFGLPCGFDYGWRRFFAQAGSRDPGVEDSAWVDRQWDTVFEFCLMILDVERFSSEDISPYLPLIHSCLVFFDEHYTRQTRLMKGQPVDENGHLVLYPGTATETYKTTLNSTVTLSALKTVTSRMLELPGRYVDGERRDYYQGFLKRLPPLPTRIMQGHKTLAPAELFDRIQNVEIPQLYPVFPYGIYGIGRSDLQLAIDTWRYGIETAAQKDHVSWHQDAIFCARLGLTEEAKTGIVAKLDDSGRRYPTFWGPGHDWMPDHNWGGSGMVGLQEMLMQTVGDDIYLFPAWPRDWDVDFRLHAPRNTVVEASLRDGQIARIQVTGGDKARLKLPDWGVAP